MLSLRRHLRLVSALWLVCQAVAVSAFMPADCSLAHQAPVVASQECTGDADGLCPMHASAGEECPLHQTDGTPVAPCVIRGLCNGPEAALSVLLSVPGILTVQSHVRQADGASPLGQELFPSLDVAATHDTPPPRL